MYRLALGLALATGTTAWGQRIERPDALRLSPTQAATLELRRGDTALAHYPAEARKAGLDAVVVVDLLINADGMVLEAQVVTESTPDHGFALAALDTVKTFEFTNPLHRLVLMSMNVEFLP